MLRGNLSGDKTEAQSILKWVLCASFLRKNVFSAEKMRCAAVSGKRPLTQSESVNITQQEPPSRAT